MSKRPFIIIGCRTDHGGTVVEGAPTTFHYGIPISRIGDAVSCEDSVFKRPFSFPVAPRTRRPTRLSRCLKVAEIR